MNSGREVKPRLQKGYYVVNLYYGKKGNKKYKTLKIHRLMAKAFIPNPLNLPLINHKNGDRSDNRIKNLEWCDYAYNAYHANNILHSFKKGEESPRNKYPEKIIRQICEMIEEDFKPKIIAKTLDIPVRLVRGIMHKESWNHIIEDYNFENYSWFKPQKNKEINEIIDDAILNGKSKKETKKYILSNFDISKEYLTLQYANRLYAIKKKYGWKEIVEFL